VDTPEKIQLDLPGILPSQPRVAPSAESETPSSKTLPSVELSSSEVQEISVALSQIALIAQNLINFLTLEYSAHTVTISEEQNDALMPKSVCESESSGIDSSAKVSSQTETSSGYCDHTNCHVIECVAKDPR